MIHLRKFLAIKREWLVYNEPKRLQTKNIVIVITNTTLKCNEKGLRPLAKTDQPISHSKAKEASKQIHQR